MYKRQRVADAMNLMRKGLIDIAHNTIASDEGFGKYTSINPKGDYIEFRSAGNTDYQADISKLRNTLLRYAQAMVVAADPALEKQEYYKKLYKLISPATGDSSFDLFARFAAGSISKEELKKQWATAALGQTQPEDEQKLSRRAELAKRIRGGAKPSLWKVYGHPQSPLQKNGVEVEAWTEEEAYEKAVAHWRINTGGMNAAAWAKANSWRAEKLKDEPKAAQPGEPTTWRAVNRDNGQFGAIIYNATRAEAERQTREQAQQYGLDPANFRVEPYTPTPAPTAQQPTSNQETSPNGVPMWEIYNRVSNEPLIRVFADHTQTSAWQTAQTWARENGYADNLNDLSVRPYVRQR